MDAEHVDEEDTSFFRHRPGGRVLMSLDDRHDGENFDDPKQETEDSLALSIVRAPLAADIRTQKRKSLLEQALLFPEDYQHLALHIRCKF